MLFRFSLRQSKTALLAALALAAFGLSLPGADPAAAGGGLTLERPEPVKPSDPTAAARFGNRVLKEGMVGPDVRVLKSIVRSKSLLRRSSLSESFDRPTTHAVRRFQRNSNIETSGVVTRGTARKMVRSMPVSVATWYGPGFWGNRTACGKVLRPGMMGVAHKTLPCGSKVLIGYRGRYVMTTVIDRGPYGYGRSWDLTLAASDAIRMTSTGVGRVRTAVVRRGK
ncbi:MAG: peptidoglycan-binding protein [Solirubrobacterales bacterium]|nr:peptidoglycan-binding protein [Solirubrobacterales bacterium]